LYFGELFGKIKAATITIGNQLKIVNCVHIFKQTKSIDVVH